MAVDIKKIETELSNGNYEEAGKLIKEILAENLTDSDKGAALVGLASAYMELLNTVNKGYLDRIKAINKDIEKIIGMENVVDDEEKIVNVRKALQ